METSYEEIYMSLTENEVNRAAHALLEATKKNEPIDPLFDSYGASSLLDGYRIQRTMVASWTAEGRRIVGKKVGLTNKEAQKNFGAREPALGHLFDDMLVNTDEGIQISRLYKPRVEGELAIVLKRELAGPGITPLNVVRAAAGVTAALEIMDTRIIDWNVRVEDLVADNCAGAAFVLGGNLVPLEELDPRYVGFVMEKNGQLASTGAGANVLGSPLESVAWLANKLAQMDMSLKADEIILTGAAAPPVPVEAGNCIHLTVDRVGQVGCYFK
jgi:2-keto-4-pentenoate hydratase